MNETARRKNFSCKFLAVWCLVPSASTHAPMHAKFLFYLFNVENCIKYYYSWKADNNAYMSMLAKKKHKIKA